MCLLSTSVSFKATISLLIFHVHNLSIDVIEALKSPTIILLLSTSPLRLLILTGLGVPLMLGARILTAVTSFCWADPFITM